MRVALLTIWHEKNYGAELQAYATVKLLQKLGCKVKMIDIRLSDTRKGNFNQKIYDLFCGLTPGHRKFKRFWKTHIPVTRRYKTIQELQEDPPNADVYIVGSDQVWNPDLTGEFSLLYFLNFGKNNVKKISFASSFGSTNWKHTELKYQVCQLLKKFNYVTCREKSGVALLEREFNIKATSVLDPTLVLGEYTELIKDVKEKNTLVYYPLYPDPDLENFVMTLSEELGLSYVNNNEMKYIARKIEWDRVSVEDWVRNIAESQLVVTRSFHGLVFSLMFHRQFAIVSTANGRSSRITDLLELLGLSNRLFDSTDELYASRIWETTIDYEMVDHKLYYLRTQSLNNLLLSINS